MLNDGYDTIQVGESEVKLIAVKLPMFVTINFPLICIIGGSAGFFTVKYSVQPSVWNQGTRSRLLQFQSAACQHWDQGTTSIDAIIHHYAFKGNYTAVCCRIGAILDQS